MMLTCATAVFNAVKNGNSEKLERCVRSVAALKTPHEHILVDGSSKDGTLDLLKELQKRISTLKLISEPDTGIYNALNKGLKLAKGKWFHVLGCDDYICDPGTLDALMSDEERPRVTWGEEMIVTPAKIGETDDRFDPAQDLWKVLWCTPYCHQGVLMRTDTMRKFGGFDERYRIAADYDLMLRLHLSARPIRYIDRTFAYFNLGGTCGRQVGAMGNEFLRISTERLALLESEAVKYRNSGILPIRHSLAFLVHPDRAVRQSARRMLKRGLAHLAGLNVKPLDI